MSMMFRNWVVMAWLSVIAEIAVGSGIIGLYSEVGDRRNLERLRSLGMSDRGFVMEQYVNEVAPVFNRQIRYVNDYFIERGQDGRGLRMLWKEATKAAGLPELVSLNQRISLADMDVIVRQYAHAIVRFNEVRDGPVATAQTKVLEEVVREKHENGGTMIIPKWGLGLDNIMDRVLNSQRFSLRLMWLFQLCESPFGLHSKKKKAAICSLFIGSGVIGAVSSILITKLFLQLLPVSLERGQKYGG